jgi:hypothetical protein
MKLPNRGRTRAVLCLTPSGRAQIVLCLTPTGVVAPA